MILILILMLILIHVLMIHSVPKEAGLQGGKSLFMLVSNKRAKWDASLKTGKIWKFYNGDHAPCFFVLKVFL